MRNMTYIAIVALLLGGAVAWAADEQATQEKPSFFASESVNITALVEAIDHETREVTLRRPQGDTVTFIASEEARNLDQVKAGDLVNAEYVRTVSVEVMANEGVEPGAGAIAGMARTKKGEMPGVAAMDTQIATATVEEINLEANTFKLKGADGTVKEFVARNPDNLKRAAVGDLVVMSVTEAIAISVESAPTE